MRFGVGRGLAVALWLMATLLPGHAEPANFILVHGATGGGWDWKKVADHLQSSGHQVFRPTLTGLGERMHLAAPNVNLSTHIRDIENLILFERLQNVVLVGHSYGGVVISGVLHKMPDKLSAVVYLDAMLPKDGMSAFDVTQSREENVAVKNGLMYFPWLGPENVFPRDVPHPLRSFSEPVVMDNPAAANIHGAFVTFRDPTTSRLLPFVASSKKRAQSNDWLICELASDHNPQRHMPARLAALIERAALQKICLPGK